MDSLPYTKHIEPAQSVSSVIWEFPVAVPVVAEGNPNDLSMRFAGRYQSAAENQFLLDKNTILSGQLCVKTLELDIARNEVKALQERVRCLEEQAALLTGELKQYKDKDEAQARLSREIWTPIRDNQDVVEEPAWDASSEFQQQQPALTTSAAPITLSQVLRQLGFQYSGTDIRKLAAVVHDAFLRRYGHPPRPMVYYNSEGQAERLSCFTEDDRVFLEEVITSCPLFKTKHRDSLSAV